MKTEQREIRQGGYYQHYKGTTYYVAVIAKHSDTLEPMVVYHCTETLVVYVRPYADFIGQVKVGDKMVYRYRYTGD